MSTSGTPAPPAARPGLVPVLVYLAMLVAVISSLGAPLIPAIAAANDVSVTSAQWALTVTLVVGAVATPVVGRLGDGRHRRAVVLVVLSVVLLGSVLAALPLGLGWLVAGRGLQGLGLAITPLAIATARTALAGERSRSTVAALSVTVAAGVGLGYPLTGAIAEFGGVHTAFWFGAGASALAIVAAALVYPASPQVPPQRLDVAGALLLGTGLASGLLALGEAETWGWTSPAVLGLAVVAVVTLVAWAVWQLRAPAPLVDLRLARGRTAATAHGAALLVGLANYLLLSSVPRLAQTPTSTGYGFGTSIVVAGLVLLPFSVASFLASRLARTLERAVGRRWVLPAGAVLLGTGEVLFAFVRTDLWQVFAAMAVAGLGVGTVFAALPALIVSAVPAGETGSAMSLNQVLRYIGFAVGSALGATVLEAATDPGAEFPDSSGYTAIGLVGLGACVLLAALTAALPAPGRVPEPAGRTAPVSR
ncbi:MFS transporter [Modestobacter italicus]|uniref:MFS transporter n=1 Tax=Modestobacter italicus (strain DSM 44449 / CECT 9708 / BC 501) TaxID=2732864 RepID=UPI00030677DC|nr:MFS transporter [Modestobacter marinus]